MDFYSTDELQNALQGELYMADRGLITAVYLALKLKRPLFLEGEPGVGKTEIAKVLAQVLNTTLIRLQCYEGLDINQAVYEWNYTRQMLHIRLLEARGEHAEDAELFGPEFLLRRPLLQAIEEAEQQTPVLLIDEVDRSDEEFEAFLLEILSDFQITVPEIGTIKAKNPPVVILTSNRTREVHDALKRRCIYYWIDYPSYEKEYEIIRAKVPDAPQRLAQEVARFIEELRAADLYKLPGIAETIDWTTALVALDESALTLENVMDTLGVVLKYQDDIAKLDAATADQMLSRVKVSL